MSTTFGTAKATRRDRRAMAEAKLLNLRDTRRSIDEAAQALHEALFNAGTENFLKGEALSQLAKHVGKEFIIEYMLPQEHLTERQFALSLRVQSLVERIRVAPSGPHSKTRKGQVERTGGFEMSQMLIWGEYPGARSFFTWDIKLNDYYTEETPDVDLVGRPTLAITVEQDDMGRPKVRCGFSYGTLTNETFRMLMITAERREQVREGFFYPETAPRELLDNFDDFMNRVEAVSNSF